MRWQSKEILTAIKSTGVTRYLLGLTITTGAVVSLPFLYYSDTVVKKVGQMLMVNVMTM